MAAPRGRGRHPETDQSRNAATSLDVVHEILRGDATPSQALKLNDRELADLVEGLREHFRNWRPPPRRPDEFRVCISDRHVGHAQRLSDLVLWVHTVVVRDPLEKWLDELRVYSYDRSEREELVSALEAYAHLHPATAAGAVLPAPYATWVTEWGAGGSGFANDDVYGEVLQLAKEPRFARSVVAMESDRAWRAIWANERSDPLPEWDAEHVRPSSPDVVDEVEMKAMTKVERLAQCEATGSRFVPFSPSDEALVELGLAALLGAADSFDEGVFRTMLGVSFPRLDSISSKEALAVRRTEESFAEWRDFLAEVLLDANAKAVAASISLQELVDQELESQLRKAQTAVSRSKSLQRYATGDMKIQLTLITAATALAAATASALPVVMPTLKLLIDVIRAGLPKKPDDTPGALLTMLREP